MYEEILAATYPGFLSIRDSKHRIIYLNDNFKNWIKIYTEINPIGLTNIEIANLVPQNVADTFLQCHDASLDLQSTPNPAGLKKIIEFRGAEGTKELSQYFDVLKYQVAIENEPHIYTIAYDITELYIENQRNLHFSTTDSMTGAQNRRYLMDNKALFCGHFAAVLDLDHFKMVNDLEGHHIGDKILCEFVVFIKEKIPETISMIRLGGDEFLTIFQNGHTQDLLKQSLQQARSQFEEVYSRYPYLSFSFGLDVVGSDMEETFIRLDKLLYEDKVKRR